MLWCQVTRLLGSPEPPLVFEYSCRLIREREKLSKTHLPVLGVTANAREERKAQTMAAGIDDVNSGDIIHTYAPGTLS